MSFIPENTPFVSLPTALKGRISPHQLAVLWTLQSYYPNIWPSYSTIAKDAGMCRTKVIHTVEQLVSLGWLQKINRVDENGKKTNAYKVTVWHECRVPAPSQTSIQPTSISATSTPNELGRCISATRGGSPDELEVKQVKLKQKTKKKGYSENFESFWKKYQSQNNKCVSQSKKPAFREWEQLDKKTQEKLEDALEADSRLRVKLIRDGKFVPMWPDCFRWIKNGQYEQFLELREQKSKSRLNPMLANKPSNQPF
tara:strand:- start:49 stop:813 length:765 start_codon:yes stop_codon:yes gene_type:complete